MELIQTQFPRFAGILGIRRRRHGDRAQTPTRAPPPGRRRGRLGSAGRGKGRKGVRVAAPRADPALPRLPSSAPHSAPARPLTSFQPSALPPPQRLSRGPGSPAEFARSAAAAQTAAPAAAAAAAMARALGPYVTSACPSTPLHPPPAETSPASRGAGGTRRGRPGSPRPPRGAGVPRVPRHVGTAVSVPWPAPSRGRSQPLSPSKAPTRGLRSGGRGLGSLGPREGTGGIGKGATSPIPRPLAALGKGAPPPHTQLLHNPSPGFRGKKSCRGASAATVLQSCERN